MFDDFDTESKFLYRVSQNKRINLKKQTKFKKLINCFYCIYKTNKCDKLSLCMEHNIIYMVNIFKNTISKIFIFCNTLDVISRGIIKMSFLIDILSLSSVRDWCLYTLLFKWSYKKIARCEIW